MTAMSRCCVLPYRACRTSFKNVIDMNDWLEHIVDERFLRWREDWRDRLERSVEHVRSEVFGEFARGTMVEVLCGDEAFA